MGMRDELQEIVYTLNQLIKDIDENDDTVRELRKELRKYTFQPQEARMLRQEVQHLHEQLDASREVAAALEGRNQQLAEEVAKLTALLKERDGTG